MSESSNQENLCKNFPVSLFNSSGVSTLFLSELSVGDEVVVSGETRTVATITSNTVATVTAAFGSDLANDTTPDCNPNALVDVIIN